MPSTIRLHRVLRSTPEKIYRAFLDADAMSKWLPPYGFTAKVHLTSGVDAFATAVRDWAEAAGSIISPTAIRVPSAWKP